MRVEIPFWSRHLFRGYWSTLKFASLKKKRDYSQGWRGVLVAKDYNYSGSVQFFVHEALSEHKLYM